MMTTSSESNAQFQVCNKTSNDEIHVAFGLRRGERSGWESEGWYTIRRQQCSTLVGRALREQHYYVYAYAEIDDSDDSDNLVWDGENQEDGADFCIREGGIFKLNAETLQDDGDNLNCEKHGFVTKKFMHVDTNGYTDFTYDIVD